MYDHAGHLLGEYDQAGGLIQELVWLGDIPVATLRPGAGGAGSPGGSTVAVYYIHTDHLDAPVKLTRPADGRVVWRWDHDPYGNGTPNEDPDGDGVSLRLNLRFAGQYADAETGLYYNMARYYDPLTGRYTQSDPIGLAGGLNTYGYVGGNPVTYTDPLGLKSRHDPNGRVCQDHRKKIADYKADINKRIRELAANPGGLPYYPPYLGAPEYTNQQGHEDLCP